MGRDWQDRMAWTIGVVGWILAVIVGAARAHEAIHTPGVGTDFAPVYQAATAFLHGRSVFVPMFVYPPSCAMLAAAIVETLTLHQAESAVAYGEVIAIMLVVGGSFLAATSNRWRFAWSGFFLILLLKGNLTVGSLPLENFSILLAPAALGIMVLFGRDRRTWATGLLAVSLIVKPLLLPLLLVPVAARRWGDAVVAAASATVAVLVASVTTGDIRNLPSAVHRLLGGYGLTGSSLSVYNTSLSGFGTYHHLQALTNPIRIVLGVSILWVIAAALQESRRSLEDAVLLGSLGLAAAYLIGSLSEDHYVFTLIPGLVVIGVRSRFIATRTLLVVGAGGAIFSTYFLHFGASPDASQLRVVAVELAICGGLLVEAWRRYDPLGLAAKVVMAEQSTRRIPLRSRSSRPLRDSEPQLG